MMPSSAGKRPGIRIRFLGLVGAAGLLAVGGCSRPSDQGYDPEKAVSIQAGQIQVAGDSPFLKHLEMGAVARTQAEGRLFKVVGQIIALANSSDALGGPDILWAELDPALTASLGLRLAVDGSVAVGEAYGMAELPAEYGTQVARGDVVSISRYGLRKYESNARVVSVQPAPEDGDWLRVLLKIPPGDEWYPGNNCEVAFPTLRSRPVSVPTTALLHEGSQEYLLKETAPGRFQPVKIAILDTLGESALVIGKIAPDSRIVSRGAILLKPYLHEVLRVRATSAQPLGGGR